MSGYDSPLYLSPGDTPMPLNNSLFVGMNPRIDKTWSKYWILNSCFLALSAIQCALLHPKFKESSLSTWARQALGPLTISWWLLSPYRYAAMPLAMNTAKNAQQAMLGLVMFMKTVDWTFSRQTIQRRRLEMVDGVPKWQKEIVLSYPTDKCTLGQLVGWTVVQMLSQRGLGYSWGPEGATANTRTLGRLFKDIASHSLILISTFSFLLHMYNAPLASPKELFISVGVPSLPGLDLFARAIQAVCLCFFISSAQELHYTMMVLVFHLIHPLMKSAGLPMGFCEFFDPIQCPPLYNGLVDLHSVSHFWGKSWHQNFRRGFIICGGKPLIILARSLGVSFAAQKAFGAFGVYTFSAIFHDYPFYFFTQDRVAAKGETRSRGMFLFFFLQFIGVVLDPLIIPRIPRSLGGGRLWTAVFLLCTSQLLIHANLNPGGIISRWKTPIRSKYIEAILPNAQVYLPTF